MAIPLFRFQIRSDTKTNNLLLVCYECGTIVIASRKFIPYTYSMGIDDSQEDLFVGPWGGGVEVGTPNRFLISALQLFNKPVIPINLFQIV